MTEILLLPAIEAWAVSYLTDGLTAHAGDLPYAADVAVATALPNPRPARAVVVRIDTATRLDRIRHRVRLACRVYSDDELDGTDLAALCLGLLDAAAGSGPVIAIDGAFGPFPVPEESGDHVRFLAVELRVRRSAL